MRKDRNNAILSHEVVSGMEGEGSLFQLLNTFPDRLGSASFTLRT